MSENGGVASEGVLEPVMRMMFRRMGRSSLAAFKYLVEHGHPYTGGRRDVLGRCCEPAAEEIPHGLRGRRGQRPLPVLLCNHEIPCSPMQIAQYGVP